MIDQLLGRPSPKVRRTQIFLILFFWIWRLYKGDGATNIRPRRAAFRLRSEPRRGKGSWVWRLWVGLVGRRMVALMGKVNQRLKYFTPYQLILATLTVVYALRHFDDLLGISAPEPLARMYSRSYYRATYVNTAFDAGFSMAMNIKPKWIKDICSILFSAYYLVYAREGDEVLRRFRAVCSVEMLRVTWEKTSNPYVRLFTLLHRPSLRLIRKLSISRPSKSSRASLPPVKIMLFFSGTAEELATATDVIMDFPGGGFIAMGPECHEERLRIWARRTGKPVIGVDYGKAPEYPYPWAIEEGFDAYRTLMETKGEAIGIKSGKLDIVLTGDSAGGNICTTIMLRILEHPTEIPKPISIVLAYPVLDFNFTSWMSPQNLRVLRTEQSETLIPGLVDGKDHMSHKAPLSVVGDVDDNTRKRRHQRSWTETISQKLPLMSPKNDGSNSEFGSRYPVSNRAIIWMYIYQFDGYHDKSDDNIPDNILIDDVRDNDSEPPLDRRNDAEKSLADRVKTPKEERKFLFTRADSPQLVESLTTRDKERDKEINDLVEKKRSKKAPIGTRLTMTSRVGYFQDRVISPSMMRAMAILYVGPRRNPDFETDYHISPILSPPHLLAHFPPVYLICGERDPFVDDTVIFSGKIREAKRARKAQAETKILDKSAKFGESLRMSATGKHSGKNIEPVDPILLETDDDWVQMRIIEGWGHGFMQMSSIMREIDTVLKDIADWIDGSFVQAKERQMETGEKTMAHNTDETYEGSLSNAVDYPMHCGRKPLSVHLKPSQAYNPAANRPLGGADLGSAYAGDVADENDNMVTFTPKVKSKKTIPLSKFQQVPRRPSKESLELHRSPSFLKFDIDEIGVAEKNAKTKTLPPDTKSSPPVDSTSRGSATFGLFSSGKGIPSPIKIPTRSGRTSPTLFGVPRRSPLSQDIDGKSASKATTPPVGSLSEKPKNSLVAVAVAGARAASPALAAAGLVQQSVGSVSEAELLRRRRMEAVYGISGTTSEDDE
nr:hormone-sensitive lipase [Cryptococcus depauperatus CBS 7841]